MFYTGLPWTLPSIHKSFPYPLMDVIAFKWSHIIVNHNTIHHKKCFSNNYILRDDGTHDVNKCCDDLRYNKALNDIITRASLNVTELPCYSCKYLNFTQLHAKIQVFEKIKNELKLEGLNNKRNLARLGGSLGLHQRLVSLMATNNVPRIKELLSVALRNRRSLNYIVDKVKDAIDGVYSPRPSKEDKDLAVLVLKIRGPRLLDICFKANMLPSTTTAYRIAKSLKPFRLPITWSILECLENNLPVQLIDSYAASLKVDETYITP